jgi:hypothetical protein
MPFGLYNPGVLEHTRRTENGEDVKQILLLGRLPPEAGEPGKGDPGPIVLCVMEDGAVISTTELWRPEADNEKGDQLEDARIVQTEDGTVIIGFTRLVYSEADQKHHPFPAIAFTNSEDLLAGNFPDTYLIDSFGEGDETTPLEDLPAKLRSLSGKNVTPLKDREFMFRQEDDNHALTLISLNENNQAKLIQRIVFPEELIPMWAMDKMGTTMPPIWLNNNEALFLIHGFTRIDDRPQYMIGSARLFKDENGKYSIDNISAEPLLTPQGLTKELFPGRNVQLHEEERDAMYMCGGVVEKDENGKPKFIKGLVSIGDMITIETTITVEGITDQWVRPKAVTQFDAIAA